MRDINIITNEFAQLVKSFDGEPNQDISNELGQIRNFFSRYREELTRKEMYGIIQNILQLELTDYQETIVWDFGTGIIGACDKSCLDRYLGEEHLNIDDLIVYLREKKWFKD